MGITFCEECRDDVDFYVQSELVKDTLKGEKCAYTRETAVCSVCKKEVYVAELEDKNLKALYDAYRKQNNLISLEKILELPEKYHVGDSQLSLLLGWEEMTFSRYCDGYLPAKEHSEMLCKMYYEPEYANFIVECNNE